MRKTPTYQSKNEIQTWLHHMEIQHYVIHDNLTVDIHSSVDLTYSSLKSLPFKFGKINGSFNCAYNQLENFTNFPTYVTDDLDCSYNNITSLEGMPFVEKEIYLGANKLKNLIGAPEIVYGDFLFWKNEITSLKGTPKVVQGRFFCANNLLEKLDYMPEKIETFVCSGHVKIENFFNTEITHLLHHTAFCEEDKIDVFKKLYQKHEKNTTYILEIPSSLIQNTIHTLKEQLYLDNQLTQNTTLNRIKI